MSLQLFDLAGYKIYLLIKLIIAVCISCTVCSWSNHLTVAQTGISLNKKREKKREIVQPQLYNNKKRLYTAPTTTEVY